MTDFRPADPWSDPTWDGFVRSSPDGWAWGLAGWQRLIERVPEWNLKPLSFDMRENGTRVALMPLHLTRDGSAASSGWGWIGPMLSADLDPTRRKNVLHRVMREAERRALEAGAHRLTLGTPPTTSANLTALRGVNPFFELGYDDTSTNSLVVDLTSEEESLWMALSASARQEIRKATKAGYRVRRASWFDHLESYYEAHAETYRRTGIEPHPRAYFEGIAREMEPAGAALLWAGFDPDGRLCAFHNDAVFGPVTLYHTGCSFDEGLAGGINYLLMWASIQDAKVRGGRWYEVGDVFYPARHGKQEGLTRFKSKFGGTLHRNFKALKNLAPKDAAHEPDDVGPREEAARKPALWDRLRSAITGAF